MFGFVDILRIIAILSFGIFSGWVIYRLMKSADVDEEQESEELFKGEKDE